MTPSCCPLRRGKHQGQPPAAKKHTAHSRRGGRAGEQVPNAVDLGCMTTPLESKMATGIKCSPVSHPGHKVTGDQSTEKQHQVECMPHDANTNTTTQDTTTKPKTSGLDHPSPFQHTARKAPPPTTPAPAAPGHRCVEHLRPASLLGRVSAYTCGVDPTHAASPAPPPSHPRCCTWGGVVVGLVLFSLLFYFVPLRHCRAHSHQSPLSSQSGRSLEPPRPVRRDRHRGRCDS